MKLALMLSGLVSLLLLAGCAHHRDVRPGASGVHQIKLQTEDKDDGTRDAIQQANHYCDQYKKHAAFVSEKATYTGSMSEKDYNNMKTAGRVGKAVGGTVWALGGRNESNAGGVVGLGGVAADSIAGKGYTVEMTFKCQ